MGKINFKIVFGAYFWNQFNKIFEFALVFATSIVITRLLGPHDYGIYAAVNSIAGLFILFASFGFEQIINTQIPKFLSDNRDGESSYLLKKILLFRVVILCFSFIILYLFSAYISQIMNMTEMSPYLKLIAFFVILNGSSSLLSYMLIAQLKMQSIAKVNLISKSLKLFFAYILLSLGLGIPASSDLLSV